MYIYIYIYIYMVVCKTPPPKTLLYAPGYAPYIYIYIYSVWRRFLLVCAGVCASQLRSNLVGFGGSPISSHLKASFDICVSAVEVCAKQRRWVYVTKGMRWLHEAFGLQNAFRKISGYAPGMRQTQLILRMLIINVKKHCNT